MSEPRRLGEKVVEMLCDGKSMVEIFEELQPEHYLRSKHQLEKSFEIMRRRAGLPLTKRAYKENKADILANVDAWNKHQKRMADLESEFRKSLVSFRGL